MIFSLLNKSTTYKQPPHTNMTQLSTMHQHVYQIRSTYQIRIHIILFKNKNKYLIDSLKGFFPNPLWPQTPITNTVKGRRQEGKVPSLSLCVSTHIWIISPLRQNYRAMKLHFWNSLCSSNALLSFFQHLSQLFTYFNFSF